MNLYGQNTLKTKDLEIEQTTGYPWDGHITLTVRKAKTLKSIRMHIPAWATDMQLRLNGQPILDSRMGYRHAAATERTAHPG